MRTAVEYLREIHRIAHDDTLSTAERVGRIQAEAFVACIDLGTDPREDAEAVALDNAAHESAQRASYGALAHDHQHIAAFKEAVAGRPCSIASIAAREGYGAGLRYARHGGGRASASFMGATMANDSTEMPAEAMSRSAAVAS